MEWLWIFQLLINAVVCISLVVWWKDRRAGTGLTGGSIAILQQIESRVEQWEHGAVSSRKKNEEQLHFLFQLCEQARGILMRHKGGGSPGAPTLEEEELKAMRSQTTEAFTQAIPRVKEIESRKLAHRSEIPVDLRSVLRDQLS